MYLPFRFGEAAGDPATVLIDPTDPIVSFSDYIGTVVQTDDYRRTVRPVVDGQGFENAAPGVRWGTTITLERPGYVIWKVGYNGLITRNDLYNDIGSIYINGEPHSDVSCPTAWAGAGNNHPIADNVPHQFRVPAGEHLIEFLPPYDAGVQYEGLVVPEGAVLSASTRPADRIIFITDSIGQGFNSSRNRLVWTLGVGEDTDKQIAGLTYGGRAIIPSDGLAIAGLSNVTHVYWAVLVNNAIVQTALVTVTANALASFQNMRTSYPSAKIIIQTAIRKSVDTSPITMAQYRTAVASAFATWADGNSVLVDGLTMITTDANLATDLLHPNDAGEAEYRSNAAPHVT